MSEGQLKDLIDVSQKGYDLDLEMKKKLEELVQKTKEDVMVEKEGNLIEQRGNYISVSFI